MNADSLMQQHMQELDARALKCPLPILRAKKALAGLPSGSLLRVWATDPGAPEDFAAFCAQTGHELLLNTQEDNLYCIVLKRKNE